jgi:RNA polymerase sigma-70 factor, ECF subfamily
VAPSAADRDLLAEHYRLYAAGVYRRCLAMCGGETALAEDVTQDVFVRLIEKGPARGTPAAVSSWLLTVADRLCVDRLRREHGIWARVRAALEAAGHTPPARPDSRHADDAILRQLRQALASLPEREHTVVVQKYLGGKPQTEIARELGCSDGYVSKLLARAVGRLRQLGWEIADA